MAAARSKIDAAGLDDLAIDRFVRGRWLDRARCSARIVVKVGGICCVISTGKRSITGPSSVTSAIRACGPPVDEPIRSTRGACMLNARCISCATGDGVGRVNGSLARSSVGASGGAAGAVRRTLAPSERIFWIRSW